MIFIQRHFSTDYVAKVLEQLEQILVSPLFGQVLDEQGGFSVELLHIKVFLVGEHSAHLAFDGGEPDVLGQLAGYRRRG